MEKGFKEIVKGKIFLAFVDFPKCLMRKENGELLNIQLRSAMFLEEKRHPSL